MLSKSIDEPLPMFSLVRHGRGFSFRDSFLFLRWISRRYHWSEIDAGCGEASRWRAPLWGVREEGGGQGARLFLRRRLRCATVGRLAGAETAVASRRRRFFSGVFFLVFFFGVWWCLVSFAFSSSHRGSRQDGGRHQVRPPISWFLLQNPWKTHGKPDQTRRNPSEP